MGERGKIPPDSIHFILSDLMMDPLRHSPIMVLPKPGESEMAFIMPTALIGI